METQNSLAVVHTTDALKTIITHTTKIQNSMRISILFLKKVLHQHIFSNPLLFHLTKLVSAAILCIANSKYFIVYLNQSSE